MRAGERAEGGVGSVEAAAVPASVSAEFAAVKSGLRAIGYRGRLLRHGYAFADLLADVPAVRTIPLAAFAQDPPSYVNACFGVALANGDPVEQVRRYTALGAPQILLLQRGTVGRWAVQARGAPRHLGQVRTAEIRRAFAVNRGNWSPAAIWRAKSPILVGRPRQVDFVDVGLLPALERQAQTKLDELITDVLREARRSFSASCGSRQQFPEAEFFRSLFGLIRAKVLRDSGAIGDIGLSDPLGALRRVEAYYPNEEKGEITRLDLGTLAMIAERVARAFPLDNLSAETLAYVYEHTLVTPEQRRLLGIHSTPPYVADYILSRLPLEEVPAGRRNVLDPTCGRGTLLVAALRRLRALLPQSTSQVGRHEYLVDHIRGIDLEPYTCEVAKLSLVLADLPNPNGWQVTPGDIFAKGQLEHACSRTSVLVSNPPFERFDPPDRGTYGATIPYKGGELLLRALPALPPGGLVGVVMPRKLLEGRSYGPVRRELAASFEVIEITSLPDNVFPKSDAETVLLMARKLTRGADRRGTSLLRHVRRQDRERFETGYDVSWEREVPRAYFAVPAGGKVPSFHYPEFDSLWHHLNDGPRVADIAEIHRGVEYVSGALKAERDVHIRRVPFEGAAAGLASAGEQIQPLLLGEPVYLDTDERIRRGGAWDLRWEKPKVVTNANRASRGPWRLIAAVDEKGLVCTQTFHGIWPRDRDMPLSVLAAVLNGPLANAFVYDHEPERDNRNETIGRIPLPRRWQDIAAIVPPLVNAYEAAVSKDELDGAAELITRIDAEVLRAYALPPREERRLLDLFWGVPRSGVPRFAGYIAPEFTAWIPLHLYISPQFRRSTAQQIRQRGASTTDPGVIRFFDEIP